MQQKPTSHSPYCLDDIDRVPLLRDILEECDLTRFVMYYRLGEYLGTSKRQGQVLTVSATVLARFFTECELRMINYPKHDIHRTPFPAQTFDWILMDQVLEHLKNPWQAIREIHRLLRPGGRTIITTCFVNPYHAMPEDYGDYE